MKLTIEITCDNAAFEEDPAGECARILNLTAHELENPMRPAHAVIRDINGNGVGWVKIDD